MEVDGCVVVPLPLYVTVVTEGGRVDQVGWVDHDGWELGGSDETPEVVSVAGVTVEAVRHCDKLWSISLSNGSNTVLLAY